MPGHALLPVFGCLLTAPARPVCLKRLLSGFPERRYPGLALLSERVAPGPCKLAVLEGRLARLDQTDQRKPAQADITAPAVYGEALDLDFEPPGATFRYNVSPAR